MSEVVISWFWKTEDDGGVIDNISTQNVAPIEASTNDSTNLENKLKPIYYVFVCEKKVLHVEHQRKYISKFLQQLEEVGFQLDKEWGKRSNNLLFIKVYMPDEVLKNFANAAGMTLDCDAQIFESTKDRIWNLTATDIDLITKDSPLYKRAPFAFPTERPPDITKVERLIVIKKLLDRAVFCSDPYEFGVDKLLSKKVLAGAYPLHDGQWEWTTAGPLNERQLLARFWSKKSLWYKNQPLELIKMYFGPEFALHCALLGFVNKMLFVPAIVGIVCFSVSIVMAYKYDPVPAEEVCMGNIKMCPRRFIPGDWRMYELREMCTHAKLITLFDNPSTIIYAIFMAFWAATFLLFWERHHKCLLYRWNLCVEDIDSRPRLDYQARTKYRRISPISHLLEPYVPLKIILMQRSITVFSCCILIFILLFTVFCFIVITVTVSHALRMSPITLLRHNVSIITSLISSCLSVTFIKFYGMFYRSLALLLTNIENPRTELEFNNSYVYKLFLLAFVNNYCAVCYTAFLKGKLYTYPGDERMLESIGIRADMCDPGGCIFGLGIQLTIIMFFRALFFNIIVVIKACFATCKKKIITKPDNKLPQWEEDFSLNKLTQFYLIEDYIELVMQFGLMSSFVAASPLVPFFVLANNYLQIRHFADKYVKFSQRPVPARIPGIPIWNGLLEFMKFTATICNALIIAFTSNVTQREIYKYTVDPTLKGYINSTLSVYQIGDKIDKVTKEALQEFCYYDGRRFPPGHPHKYHLKPEYWFELTVRFLLAFIMEHFILLFAAFLASCIPDIPYTLRQEIDKYHNKSREQNIKNLRERLSKSAESWRRFELPADI